VKNSEEKV